MEDNRKVLFVVDNGRGGVMHLGIRKVERFSEERGAIDDVYELFNVDSGMMEFSAPTYREIWDDAYNRSVAHLARPGR